MSETTQVENGEQFEEIMDVPVDEKFIKALREAGASELLVRVAQVGPEQLPEDVMNKPRLELQKYCYWNDEVSAETFQEYQHYGGGAFQKFWNDNIHTSDRMGNGSLDADNVAVLEVVAKTETPL